jgi:predicted Zn-dependent protease
MQRVGPSRATLEVLDRTKRMRRAGQDRQAEELLKALIDSTEEAAAGGPVEHWLYEHLAVLYLERGDPRPAVEVLERYARQQPTSQRMAAMMARRLDDARNRLEP